MSYTKRCPRCSRAMRTKELDAWYECSCGNAWIKGRGFFMKSPDMTISRSVRQIGDISTNVIEITSSIPGTPPLIYALGPSKEGFSAIKTPPVETEEERLKRLAAYEKFNGSNIVYGGIYYIKRHFSEGCEVHSGRPGIIVSNKPYSAGLHNLVTVVYLTTKVKRPSVTRVPITSSGTDATALCESVTTIDVSKVSDCIGVCTDEEMTAVKTALANYLNIRGDVALAEDINPNIKIAKLEETICNLKEVLRDCLAQLNTHHRGCPCCCGHKAIHWENEQNNVFISSFGNMDIMVQGNKMTIKVDKCPVCGRWFSLRKT